MTKKYFGTGGVRGEVDQLPIIPNFVLKLSYAAEQMLVQHDSEHRSTVLIGKDAHISGYMLETALMAGFTSAGVNVIQTGPLPTSDVAYLTRTLRLSAGVMTSASHNVYSDDDIELFAEGGVKLNDEIELEIEAKIDEEMRTQPSDRLGHAHRINDADDRYTGFCKSTFPNHLDLCGLKLVVNIANNAGYHATSKAFRELGAQVVSIGDGPNGYNINEECGATHPKTLQAAVLQSEVDYGLALDGNGNRLMMVDHSDRVYDSGSLTYVITKARALEGIEIGGVAGMIMTNIAMEIALKEQGVQFCRTKVDDRYMLEQLHQRGWLIGDEASSHILCMDKYNAGDGIISALQILAALHILGQDLATVRADWQPYPQTMINVRIQKSQKWQGASAGVLAEVEKELEGRGYVVLRTSGTEPIARAMVGAKQTDWAKKGTERIAATIQGSKK